MKGLLLTGAGSDRSLAVGFTNIVERCQPPLTSKSVRFSVATNNFNTNLVGALGSTVPVVEWCAAQRQELAHELPAFVG